MDKNLLYKWLTLLKTSAWWEKQGRLSSSSSKIIDWDVVGEAMQSLAPSKRIWVTKHALENCGIGKTLHKWKVQSDPLYLRCNKVAEDLFHVFRCNHESNNESKQRLIMSIRRFLHDGGMSPTVALTLETGIMKWLYCEDARYNSAMYSVGDAFFEQSEIGWGNLLMGIPSKKWSYYQQKILNLKALKDLGKDGLSCC